MSDLTITPDAPITVSESINEITISNISIDPTKDILRITAFAGNRAVQVQVDNSGADPEATPPVVGEYDQVIALVNLPSITTLLKGKVEAAFAQGS